MQPVSFLFGVIAFILQLSREYGSVFTVYFGPKKVVVLAGYKTVKEALVNYADEFGDREISPIFDDLNKGHGKIRNKDIQCFFLNKISNKQFFSFNMITNFNMFSYNFM